MTAYIAFLRGLNVGAHNRMKMDALRELCESLGCENVQTYIQSGNVVFETSNTGPRSLADDIADVIDDTFGYDLSVMVRTRAELIDIVARQPFEEPVDETTKRYVTFLDEEPEEEHVQTLLAAQTEAEKFDVHGREVYSEIQKNELENGQFIDVENILGVSTTRRTWNVVTRVLELSSSS